MKISVSKKQTSKIAKELAKTLRQAQGKKFFNKAVVIGLSGELGSGKTAFCQSFAKALGVKEKVHSPTFVIMKKYPVVSSQYSVLFHFDMYRIKNQKDIITLGWKKIISDSRNIILVEWAENIRKVFPKKHFWIKMSHLGKKSRGIDIKSVK
ncbi:MAG: tRNA (adenosine(37)-N6)-threonylcarbamoyltransferase complex ATPase subunit type 1 TsaE [Candidatus Paceibacterota bacterium]